MENCIRCGISGDRVKLLNAISDNEIVKVCEECAPLSGLPIISKPMYEPFKPEKVRSVYDRLSRMSGMKSGNDSSKSRELENQETTLKGIIDKRVREKFEKEHKPQVDLVDNFNWIISRSRRSQHITQKELADAIGESEMAIRMVEQGKLPADNYRLINKLEQKLNIRIRKDDSQFPPKQTHRERENSGVSQPKELPSNLDFKSRDVKALSIADLKEIKRRKEEDLERRKKEEAERASEIQVEDDVFEEE